MNNRLSLSSLSYLPLIMGITLWQLGCGGGGVPSAVYTGEDPNVPSVILTDLRLEGDPVMVGIGSYFTIRWEPVNPPPDAVVRMYLSLSGTFDSDSIQITPEGGVSALDKAYNFSPVAGKGTTGVDYTLIARLSSGSYLYDTAKSVRKIRIGAGGVVITYPNAAITLARGLPVQVTWSITNNICETLTDKSKIIKLYVDTVPDYKDGRSIEVTPTDGIEACLNQYELQTGEIKNLQLNTPYYIIARLFIDTVENSRTVSTGTFSTTPSLVATEPAKDIQKSSSNNLSAVPVSWQVLGRDPSGLKVEILATLPDVTDDVDRVISPEYDAILGTGTADASLLPTQNYNVAVRLFMRDSKGAKITLDTATAPGKLIVPSGYDGTYDLSEMAAIATKNYSPIVGVIFEGFNIGDETGYDVANAGDINGDKFSDFMIFSKYGQEYTGGNAGSTYLIYGKALWNPIINLNSVASPTNENRPVDGTLMLFPLENSATFEGGRIRGSYKALGLPDVSGDKKGDLLIGCPEAKPLRVIYTNPFTDVTLKGDHYGLARKLASGKTYVEPGHVHSHFEVTDDTGTWVLFYPMDYSIGDTITVTVVNTSPMTVSITVSRDNALRGTSYLLTSDRLSKYLNRVLDLSLVGSASELDGLDPSAPAYDNMKTWFTSGQHFATDISVLPDINGDSNKYPELMFTIPDCDVYNFAIPSPVARNNAGKAIIVASEERNTDLRAADERPTRGSIRWIENSTWYNSSARGSNSGLYEVHILGAEANSRLTTAAGLGQFTSMVDNNTYAKGDFNGDNVPDFVVGSPGEQSGRGAIYVVPVRPVFGHRQAVVDLANFNKALPPGTDANLEVPVVGIKMIGSDPTWNLGENVRPAGDFNDDGLADAMFALPNLASRGGITEAGRVIIMFGKQGWYGDFTADQLDSHLGTQLPALIFEGAGFGDHMGQRIVSVGDVNGDNINDILIAAPDAGIPGKVGCGKIYLLYGKKNIIKKDPANGLDFVDYDGDGKPDDYWSIDDIGTKLPGAVFVGEAVGDHLQAIAPAGDVNGDGLRDFIIGAPFTNVSTVQQKAGKAYLIFGQKYVVQ